MEKDPIIVTETLNLRNLKDKIFSDKRFDSEEKIFKYSSLAYTFGNEDKFFYPVIKIDEKIIGLCKLQISPYEKDTFWINFLSVDPEYQGKGYASKLAEELFRFAKDNNFTLKASPYSEEGYEKLQNLFNKLAEKYSVKFIDNEKLSKY